MGDFNVSDAEVANVVGSWLHPAVQNTMVKSSMGRDSSNGRRNHLTNGQVGRTGGADELN
ncbi:cytochrome P450 oxidoreductase OrdA-like [Aspergillus luchuensis]|uniref:Cytochrome P450 oxidoreductase OrdA-like n=1 Tax=Aspergillus kawachii TaxID=1069201 RepID=A0A146FDZ1_ASPKA|nr:cytochrome P450 oxidoreductase OrdA-like [Aspergillus luchuensis]